MKIKRGSSMIGVAVAVVGIASLLIAATIAVVNANNNAINFSEYDFYSVIEGNKDNGGIGDHVKGSADAPVLIFEYADYQCPGCASINKRVNKAVEELNGDLGVVYRSFLLSYHQNGTAAASAAEAAGLQGYWKPYADKLFAEQSEWEYASASKRSELFNKYFEEVTEGKGDLAKFNADIASEAVSKKISFDMGIGRRIDVAGTPAFYIDGQLISWGSEGSVTVNGRTVSWDEAQSGDNFIKLIKDIVAAKLGK